MKHQQAAFAKGKPFLKGALHCHTTRSDGKGTPRLDEPHLPAVTAWEKQKS